MDKTCTCICMISNACNTSTWSLILLQWIWDIQNTNNLHLSSLFIESLRKNWPLLHSSYFLSPFLTSHCSLSRIRSLLYLWRILMKFRDALNFSTGMIFIIMSAGFFFVLIFTKSINLSSTTHWRILWYLTSVCFILLWYLWSFTRWIALWLS